MKRKLLSLTLGKHLISWWWLDNRIISQRKLLSWTQEAFKGSIDKKKHPGDWSGGQPCTNDPRGSFQLNNDFEVENDNYELYHNM